MGWRVTDLPFEAIVAVAAGLLTLIGLGTALYRIFTGKAEANAARIDLLEKRVDKLEASTAAAPGSADIHALHIALTAMSGDLKEMRATMRGSADILTRLENIVSRHEEHLLGGAKR